MPPVFAMAGRVFVLIAALWLLPSVQACELDHVPTPDIGGDLAPFLQSFPDVAALEDRDPPAKAATI